MCKRGLTVVASRLTINSFIINRVNRKYDIRFAWLSALKKLINTKKYSYGT